ncbi:MAG: hypothetical protein V4725_05700 [Bacteroidota bacterium]|nr:hypothetical protein [Ferruginibacter sp.]
MKIENIIQDIIEDTLDIRDRLEVAIHTQEPALNFSTSLPDLEKLSSVKTIELTTREEGNIYIMRAEIHTQNGSRVFEDSARRLSASFSTNDERLDQRHKFFLSALRETIKKRKKDIMGMPVPKNPFV